MEVCGINCDMCYKSAHSELTWVAADVSQCDDIKSVRSNNVLTSHMLYRTVIFNKINR